MIGLARDLRGIAFAFNTKISYMMLFEWLYPQYTPILQRAVEIWYNDPQVRGEKSLFLGLKQVNGDDCTAFFK